MSVHLAKLAPTLERQYPLAVKRLYERLLTTVKGKRKLMTKPDLEWNIHKISSVAKSLHNPHNMYKCIHVAGTNGKGSVCEKLATALHASGLRVGLLTSPHVNSVRERIRVNGELISESDFVQRLHECEEAERHAAIAHKAKFRDGLTLSYFELVTLMAYQHFFISDVDCAVIEVGLGGRYDATNIITPILSLIVSISLDHTNILGTDLDGIAWEKCGIIKPHVPVIVGPTVPHHVAYPISVENQSEYTRMSFDDDEKENRFWTFDEMNTALCQQALPKILPHFFDEFHDDYPCVETLNQLMANTRPMCRVERQTVCIDDKEVDVILDVAHNPDGISKLFDFLSTLNASSIRLVFGMSKDKDVSSCTSKVVECIDRIGNVSGVHVVEAKTSARLALSAQSLASSLVECGLDPRKVFQGCRGDIDGEIREALIRASAVPDENEIVVICGSFFIMSSVRRAIGLDEFVDDFDAGQNLKDVIGKIRFNSEQKHKVAMY